MQIGKYFCRISFLDTSETEKNNFSSAPSLFRNINLAILCYDIFNENR